jgi:peroxiredoxin Q/BCP
MSQPLEPGDLAPDFQTSVVGPGYQTGDNLRLTDLRGQTVVLYFYPKDDTPGCTKQACALRDDWKKLAKKAKLFGVSIDPVKKHEKFIAKYELPFPLISDEDRKIVETYGVWVEKTLYGRKYMGTERSTFVIDPEGKINAVLRKVSPAEHLDLLLSVL